MVMGQQAALRVCEEVLQGWLTTLGKLLQGQSDLATAGQDRRAGQKSC